MNSNDENRFFLARIREALRSNETDTPLGQAVARLKQPFVLGDGEKWHYEGFVSMFSAIRQVLSILDDSISPDLPPFLLDPATIARLFRIPLEDFNWQGGQSKIDYLCDLSRIERKLDTALQKQPEESIAAEYVSIKQAAMITELSSSHIRRAVRSGELPASNAGTRSHPVWRIARTDLDGWMEKKKGGHNVPPRSKLKELVNRHLPDLG
jgi:excisionase family DNA binding protein